MHDDDTIASKIDESNEAAARRSGQIKRAFDDDVHDADIADALEEAANDLSAERGDRGVIAVDACAELISALTASLQGKTAFEDVPRAAFKAAAAACLLVKEGSVALRVTGLTGAAQTGG